MGYLRRTLGIGKPVMGYGLGAFHLFLSASFLGSAGSNLVALGTGVLLVFVGSGMLLWGFSHHRH